MAVNRVPDALPVDAGQAHRSRVRRDGLHAHPHVAALLDAQGPKAGRDLADAVHLLCALHGRYPGLVAIAAQKAHDGETRAWLQGAEAAFEVERSLLLRLTASVGPIPSTPGAAQSESSLAAARHAIETLGLSERHGCALGAACSLLHDWQTVRTLLDRAASRAGFEAVDARLPSDDDVEAVLARASANPTVGRAIAFGGEQLLLQHRALFTLLEVRAEARGDI